MMNTISLSRIKEIFPDFGRVQLEERDFWRACKLLKVRVRRLPLPVRGCYFIGSDGEHYIYISTRLSGMEFLHTALHEFCHFLFDVPEKRNIARCSGRVADGGDDRERFADAFALAGMVPLGHIARISEDDLSADVWLSRIVNDRYRIYTEYGI